MFFPNGRRLLLLLSLAALTLGPVASHAQTPIGYQAADWVDEITLPPNLYRATQPIQLHGAFSVHTQPGAVLENVIFQGRDDIQNWDINGTHLTHVRIGGQMKFGVKATDSVFEDCEGNKDSAWFLDFWSSHWQFDNCVFSKRFVPNSLWPVDYGVHATGCTYYGLKLPAVGFKHDPADYLQKENMAFEKCRFVDCEVPVSFLAATVECVFEHCRFGPKGQTKWPKEMTPVKVTAYYSGLDNELASFVDGPVSVQFSSLLKLDGYGSTVRHTLSGGHLTLAGAPVYPRAVLLGSVAQKSSGTAGAPATAGTPATPGYFGKQTR